jgi:hypothetical protein
MHKYSLAMGSRRARIYAAALLATLLVPAAAGSTVAVSSHLGHHHGSVTADLGWDTPPAPPPSVSTTQQ